MYNPEYLEGVSLEKPFLEGDFVTPLPESVRKYAGLYSGRKFGLNEIFVHDYLASTLRNKFNEASLKAKEKRVTLDEYAKKGHWFIDEKSQQGQGSNVRHKFMREYRLEAALTVDQLAYLNPGISEEHLYELLAFWPSIYVETIQGEAVEDRFRTKDLKVIREICLAQFEYLYESNHVSTYFGRTSGDISKAAVETVDRLQKIPKESRYLLSLVSLLEDFLDKQDNQWCLDSPVVKLKIGSWELRIEHSHFTAITGDRRYVVPKDWILLAFVKAEEMAMRLICASLLSGHACSSEFFELTKKCTWQLAHALKEEPFHGIDVLKSFRDLCHAVIIHEKDPIHSRKTLDLITNSIGDAASNRRYLRNLYSQLTGHTVNDLCEVMCLEKFSNAFVNMDTRQFPSITKTGIKDAADKAARDVKSDRSYLHELKCHWRENYYKSYKRRQGRWPPATIHEDCHPGLKLALEHNLQLSDPKVVKFGEIDLDDWSLVEMKHDPRNKFVLPGSCIDWFKDTAIVPRKAMGVYFGDLRVPWKEKRAILKLAMHPRLNDELMEALADFVEGMELAQEQLIEKCTPKEGERKKLGRWFAQEPVDMRFIRQVCDWNIKSLKKIIAPESSMIMDQKQLDDIIGMFVKTYDNIPGVRVAFIHDDIKNWCMTFDDVNTKGIFQGYKEHFDCKGFDQYQSCFERTLRIFDNLYGESYYTGTPQPGYPLPINITRGGTEGRNQGAWEDAYRSNTGLALRGTGSDALNIVRGDDIRTMVINYNMTEEEHVKQVEVIHRRINLAQEKFGFWVKKDESTETLKLFHFLKVNYFDGAQMSAFMTFGAKVTPFQNELLQSFANGIGNIYSAGFSASGRSTYYADGFMLATFAAVRFVRRNRPKLNDDEIMMLLQFPSVLGGVPCQHAIQFMCSGDRDLLTMWFHYYKWLCASRPHLADYVFRITSQKFGKVTATQLCSDPDSIPILSSQRPQAYLSQRVIKMMSTRAKDAGIRNLFKLAEPKEVEEIARIICEMRPLNAYVAHNIFKSHVLHIALALVKEFLVKTIYMAIILMLGYIAAQKLFRTLEYKEKTSTGHIIGVITQSRIREPWFDTSLTAFENAENVRKNWGFGSMVGSTYPNFMETIAIWGHEDEIHSYIPPDSKLSDYVENQHITYYLDSNMRFIDEQDNPHMAMGKYKPFVHSRTDSGTSPLDFDTGSLSARGDAIKGLLRVLAYCHRPGSNVMEAIGHPMFESFGFHKDQFKDVIPVSHGTTTHHIGGDTKKTDVKVNFAHNLGSQGSSSLDTAQKFSIGIHFPYNFMLNAALIMSTVNCTMGGSRKKLKPGRYYFVLEPNPKIWGDVADPVYTFSRLPAIDPEVANMVSFSTTEADKMKAEIIESMKRNVNVAVRKKFNEGELSEEEVKAVANSLLAKYVTTSWLRTKAVFDLEYQGRSKEVRDPLMVNKGTPKPIDNMTTLGAIDPEIFLHAIVDELHAYAFKNIVLQVENQDYDDLINMVPDRDIPLTELMTELKHAKVYKALLSQAYRKYHIVVLPTMVNNPTEFLRSLMRAAMRDKSRTLKMPTVMITENVDVEDIGDRFGNLLPQCLLYLIKCKGKSEIIDIIDDCMIGLPAIDHSQQGVENGDQEILIVMLLALMNIIPKKQTLDSLIEIATRYGDCMTTNQMDYNDVIRHTEFVVFEVLPTNEWNCAFEDHLYEYPLGFKAVLLEMGMSEKTMISLVRNINSYDIGVQNIMAEPARIEDAVNQICEGLVCGVIMGNPTHAEEILRRVGTGEWPLVPFNREPIPVPTNKWNQKDFSKESVCCFPNQARLADWIADRNMPALQPPNGCFALKKEDRPDWCNHVHPAFLFRNEGATVTSADKLARICDQLDLTRLFRDNPQWIWDFAAGHGGFSAYILGLNRESRSTLVTLNESEDIQEFGKRTGGDTPAEVLTCGIDLRRVDNHRGARGHNDLSQKSTFESWVRQKDEVTLFMEDMDWSEGRGEGSLNYYQSLAHQFLTYTCRGTASSVFIGKVFLPTNPEEWVEFSRFMAIFLKLTINSVAVKCFSSNITSAEIYLVAQGIVIQDWTRIPDGHKMLTCCPSLGMRLIDLLVPLLKEVRHTQEEWFQGHLPVRLSVPLTNLGTMSDFRRISAAGYLGLSIEESKESLASILVTLQQVAEIKLATLDSKLNLTGPKAPYLRRKYHEFAHTISLYEAVTLVKDYPMTVPSVSEMLRVKTIDILNGHFYGSRSLFPRLKFPYQEDKEEAKRRVIRKIAFETGRKTLSILKLAFS